MNAKQWIQPDDLSSAGCIRSPWSYAEADGPKLYALERTPKIGELLQINLKVNSFNSSDFVCCSTKVPTLVIGTLFLIVVVFLNDLISLSARTITSLILYTIILQYV